MRQLFTLLKRYIPLSFRNHLKWLFQHRARLWRWGCILLSGRPSANRIWVYYGHDTVPGLHEHAYGGMVKFQRMQEQFPNAPRRFNILYMVSSWRPKDWRQLLWLARKKGATFIWNQNGVAYPAWCQKKWQNINRPMAQLLHAADYVFYQSQFCKLSADRFLGERNTHYEILYNAVDTQIFTPAHADPAPHHLVLLLGGTQYQYYRIETAIRTLAILAAYRSDARLLITGQLNWEDDEAEAARMIRSLLTELKLEEKVEFLGTYTQQEAPEFLRKAHILLHTKYNDPCPGLVVEAMACGLPIVYSQSGGVPELVGNEAGIGIPADLSWEQDLPPKPEALTEAILRIAERRADFAGAARQRAVEKFDLQPWLLRHHEVFEEMAGRLR